MQQGVTAEQLQDTAAVRQQQQQVDAAPSLFPGKQMRARDKAARRLHGRLVEQDYVDPATGQMRTYWSRVHFKGVARRP